MSNRIRYLDQEDGNVLIEFALICSFYIFLFSGIVDYGIYIHHEMELTEASATGAHLGTYPFQQQQISAMQNLGILSTKDIQNATISASYFYTCTPGGAQVPSSVACNGTLDYHPIMYVQVLSTASVPAAIKWVGLNSNLALQGQAIYRVPWMP